jgi:hypothetical protein
LPSGGLGLVLLIVLILSLMRRVEPCSSFSTTIPIWAKSARFGSVAQIFDTIVRVFDLGMLTRNNLMQWRW